MDLRLPASSRSGSRALIAQLAFTALLLAGCGGGGPDTAGTGAAPNSFASGTITGFGSVIVNGVRFDDSTARVSDDDGTPDSKDNLKLGMTVEVHGGAISDDGTGPRAVATEIVHGAALVGPVSVIDPVGKTLVVLGQTVAVLDTTVFAERIVGGLAGLTVGMLVEIHGQLDVATGVYTARRVGPTAAVAGFGIRGIVANLDTAARTFTMGGTLISYAGLAGVPATLANGTVVSVRLQTAQVAGAWVAMRIRSGLPPVPDVATVRLRGTVTAFTSTAQFSVNGIAIDASQARFEGGSAGLVLGAVVDVRGTSGNGVVTATRVEVESHAAERAEGFELHGAITTIDTAAKSFVVRGVAVDYASSMVEFRKGTAAQLAVGVRLEVKGTLSPDGTHLQATRIAFED